VIPENPDIYHTLLVVIQHAVEKAVVIANVTLSIAVGGIKAMSRAFRRGECDEASSPILK